MVIDCLDIRIFFTYCFDMPKHDFSAPFEACPATIELMPAKFKSHQPILRHAQLNQRLYVKA